MYKIRKRKIFKIIYKLSAYLMQNECLKIVHLITRFKLYNVHAEKIMYNSKQTKYIFTKNSQS